MTTGATMDLRNRIGLYGAYFFGMAGIGFCLPFFPVSSNVVAVVQEVSL